MFLKTNLIEAITVLTTSEVELYAFTLRGDKSARFANCSEGTVYFENCACNQGTEVYIVPSEYRSYFAPHSRNTSYSRKESFIRDLQSDLNRLEELLQSSTDLPDWAIEILIGNQNSIQESLSKIS